MAFKVPNPFLMLDDLLLDRVFNPFTGWSEHQYGKDAMSICLVVSLIGYALIVLVMSFNQYFFLAFIVSVCAGNDMARIGQRRKNWLQNTRTGKNFARMLYFDLRMFEIAVVFLLSVLQLSISVVIIGLIMAFIVPLYLDATDTLPPNYHESKRTRLIAGSV